MALTGAEHHICPPTYLKFNTPTPPPTSWVSSGERVSAVSTLVRAYTLIVTVCDVGHGASQWENTAVSATNGAKRNQTPSLPLKSWYTKDHEGIGKAHIWVVTMRTLRYKE